MRKQEFIDAAKAAGKSKEETLARYNQLEAEGRFDDSVAPVQPPSPQPPAKKSFIESLFPSMIGGATADNTAGDKAKAGLNFTTDVLSSPARAAATTRGMDFGNPSSFFFKPEAEAIGRSIDKATEKPAPSKGFPVISFGSYGAPSPTVKESASATKTGVNLLASALSDPTSLFTGTAKGAANVAIPVAKKIEQGVIGTGGKSVGRLQNVKLPKVAEDVLVNNLAGTAEQTYEKSKAAMSGLEDEIAKVLSGHPPEESIDNLIDVDAVIDGIKNKVQSDPQYAGVYKDLNAQLDYWKEALVNYKLNGVQSLTGTQKAMRSVGQGAFKTKGIPSPDVQAKELAADEIKMALADEIKRIAPEIAPINEKYRTLIPIKKLAQNRIWTDQSQRLISAGDIWATIGGAALGGASGMVGGEGGFDPQRLMAGVATGLAYKASKSGNVAQKMYNTGKTVKRVTDSDIAKALSAGTRAGAASTGLRSKDEDR